MKDRFRVIPAVYIILRKNEKVLLIRRANTGYFDGWYGLPAGHLDGGESAIQAAVREAKEEVGVDIPAENLRFVHIMHRVAEEGTHERVDFFFEVTSWEGEPANCEPEKCDDLRWFSLDGLPENTIPVVAQALVCADEGRTYSESGF